jgi:proliferating cell nuclear antigen
MKTIQIQDTDDLESEVFLQSSESVLVGFTTEKATLLQIVKSAECMYSDATFTIDEEGLSYRAMDPSHVAMIDMGIPNTCFEKWSCIEKQKFALNIEEFRRLINSLDAKGSVSIEIHNKKINVKQNGFSASVKTIEPSETDCPLPHLSYENRITFSEDEQVNVLEFTRLVRKIESVSDYVTINCDMNKVLFSGEGDKGSCDKQYTREECGINNREDSETTYSLGFLMPYLRTLTKDSQIELAFSSQKPMRIQTRVNNLGRIDFYLAPRVEN